MARPHVLIVEHDEAARLELARALGDEWSVLTAENTDTALSLVREHNPTIILLEIGFPPHPDNPEEGLRFVRGIRKLGSHGKVIVLTGSAHRQHAVRAVSYGAFDVFTKPVDLDLLRLVMRRACWIAELEQERVTLPPETEEEIEEMIGTSERIRRVFAAIRKVATTDVPVLVIGESGTGKELTAKAIHERSLRRGAPFITINCGAIPETLLESELFGHERGAFTGAIQQKKGKVEYAHGGTLFLDEVGELPLALQVKLLRFLHDQTLERVGGRQQIQVDARLIAATNMDLKEAIAQGKFREDLYYRLGVVAIDVPPLRERGEDVLLIALVFLKRVAEHMRKRILGFTKEAIWAIQAYPWPGNVRELSNKIRRAVVMAEGPYIAPEDLDLSLPEGEALPGPLSLKAARERVEMDLVVQALTLHSGNLRRVADELGISRPTLYLLLRKYGIRIPEKENKGNKDNDKD
jgi:two-component system NtrC family response regulator